MKINTNGRNDRLLKEKRHDTYKSTGKINDSTLCPSCGAFFHNGRWTWKNGHAVMNSAVCPACRRIDDNYPAGFLEMKGEFLFDHLEEIINLIKNTEKLEKEQRPLERIMKIMKEDEKTVVTTTGVHIARRIARALSDSYKGDLQIQSPPDESTVRVHWER